MVPMAQLLKIDLRLINAPNKLGSNFNFANKWQTSHQSDLSPLDILTLLLLFVYIVYIEYIE